MLIIGYPLFFQAGKFWHYVLKSGYPLFQAGKVSIFHANKFGLSSVLVGREV